MAKRDLTDLFVTLELQKPSDELDNIRRSPDLEARKWWKGLSGRDDVAHCTYTVNAKQERRRRRSFFTYGLPTTNDLLARNKSKPVNLYESSFLHSSGGSSKKEVWQDRAAFHSHLASLLTLPCMASIYVCGTGLSNRIYTGNVKQRFSSGNIAGSFPTLTILVTVMCSFRHLNRFLNRHHFFTHLSPRSVKNWHPFSCTLRPPIYPSQNFPALRPHMQMNWNSHFSKKMIRQYFEWDLKIPFFPERFLLLIDVIWSKHTALLIRPVWLVACSEKYWFTVQNHWKLTAGSH